MRKGMSSIFEEQDCLSENQLMDYLNGRLSEQQMHSVEAHIADCDFCSDALDGLMQVQNKDQIPIIVRQIHNHVRHHLKMRRVRKKKVKMYVWLSAVVIILLIILLIAFLAEYYSMK